MDVDSLERLLTSIERNEKNLFARDVIEASPLAQEILNARPYAYLDDAPLEERRTRAVQQRRWLDPQTASDMGKLDQGAIDRVRDEAWPRVENADELHDALVELGFVTEQEGEEWQQFFSELKNDRRAAVLKLGLRTSCTGSAGVRRNERGQMSGAAAAGETPAVPVKACCGLPRNVCRNSASFTLQRRSTRRSSRLKVFTKTWAFEEALVEDPARTPRRPGSSNCADARRFCGTCHERHRTRPAETRS